MHICFHVNQLGLRGTEVAVYQYAHYNETLLHNTSSILVPKQAEVVPEVLEKFKKRFPVYFYTHTDEIDQHLEQMQADAMYALKAGLRDAVLSKKYPTLVHVVFKHFDPHGTVYAYISQWLASEMTHGKSPYVPHMIDLPEPTQTLHDALQIPEQALVFGRYGGYDTFDIPFVKRAVYRIANRNPNIYFLFLNTEDFIASKKGFYRKNRFNWWARIMYPKKRLKNVIFLPGTTSDIYKANFIHTCQAMLHARAQGESFGIACGEFSIFNKPVLTCTGYPKAEKAHIEILGTKGIYYNNAADLKSILVNFKVNNTANYDAYSNNYSPEPVMHQFYNVFLKPLTST